MMSPTPPKVSPVAVEVEFELEEPLARLVAVLWLSLAARRGPEG